MFEEKLGCYYYSKKIKVKARKNGDKYCSVRNVTMAHFSTQ
jgi:hypothetical protein